MFKFFNWIFPSDNLADRIKKKKNLGKDGLFGGHGPSGITVIFKAAQLINDILKVNVTVTNLSYQKSVS